MTKHNQWVIELLIPGRGEPLRVEVEKEVIIGRNAPGQERKVDIDLQPYGGGDQGVSRQHVTVYIEEDNLRIKDMDSGNGTLQNGVRLVAHQGYPLNDNDTILLGRMPIEFHIVSKPLQPTSGVMGKGERILIVDDDPQIAQVLSVMLERVGYQTIVTHEVVGAIRAFNQKRPAVVLLDLWLPEMSGLEFCRYVRRSEERNSVPIVVISADKAPERQAEAKRAGADKFMTKPVQAEDLRQTVAELIRGQQSPMLKDKETKILDANTVLPTEPAAKPAPQSAVMFVTGHGNEPLTLNLKNTMSFGRERQTGNLQHHIDLSRFGAGDLGVSRVHMFIHSRNGQFYVEDAGSTNGTFVNGDKIAPYKLTGVSNGDEIKLGDLKTYLYYLDEEEVKD